MSDKKKENKNFLQINLDNMIKNKMKGESSMSSLNYSPYYQQDEASRLILHGNTNSVSRPLNYDCNLKYLEPDRYFSSVQHQYLNYHKMWNLQDDNKLYDKDIQIEEEKQINLKKETSIYSKNSNQTKYKNFI
jgi:hypothetical protein